MSRRFINLKSGASAVAVLASVTSAQAAATVSGPATSDPYTNAQTDIVTINLDATLRADATTNDSFFNNLSMSNGTANLIINDSALLGDIVNAGSMVATTGSAVQIINDSQVFGQVSNSGLISGTGVGLKLDGDSTIGGGLYNSGTIGAGSTAVLIGDDSELIGGIHNSGRISANGVGISVNDANAELWGGIHNAQSGLIYAGSTAAILLSGSVYDGGITNAGIIRGQTGADGIRMTTGAFDGDIVNTGVIETTASSATAIEISGGTFTGSISNTGSILADATSSIAINISGGTFVGNINNTDDGSNRGRISADLTAVAVANTSFTGDVNNSGDIASANGVGVSISATTFTGDVNNLAAGVITANQTALLVTAATFTGNISNAGTISSTSNDAVIIDSATFTGNVVNAASGLLSGVTHALVFSGTAFTGNVTNDGSISADDDAVRIESGTTLTGAVTNNGAITSTSGDGVVVAGTLTGTLDNTADGTIQGDHNGITIESGGSVSGGITNSGTIIATTNAAIDVSAATVAHTINQAGGLLRGGSGATIATAVDMSNVGVQDRLNADGGVIDGDIIGGATNIDDVVMTPDDKVVYLRGTASNIDRFDMAGAGTAILGAAARGATGTQAVGVTIGAASMTHSGSGTLYLDDDTVVTLSGAYTQNDGKLEFFLTPDTTTHGAINAATAVINDGDIAAYIDPVAFALTGGDTFTYANVITGTRTGNFDNAADIDVNSLFFEGHVVTHAAAFDIVLGRLAFADALVLPGLTKNQMSVGDAIETIYGNGGYGTDFQDLFAYLFSLPAGSEEDVQHTYDELAGAELADTQEIGLRLGHSFDNAVSGRLAGLRGTADSSTSEARLGLRRLAEADPIVASDAMPEGGMRMRGAQTVGIWAQAYGDWTDASGDEEAAGYDQESKGAAIGADVAINQAVRAGAAIGWSNADADFNTAGDGTEIDAFHAAVYTAFETGHFYADAILSYGAQDVTTNRLIDLGFGSFAASAGYNATAWNAEAQVGWIADLGAVALEPFAALRYALLQTDAFQETGAGSYNLFVDSQDADSLASSLGARLSASWTGGGVRYLPSLEVAWRHEYLDDRQTILAAFEEDPATRFQIVSSAMASDSAVVRARFGAELNRNLMVHLDYNGLYNSSANTHGATAGITASW